MYDNYMVDTPRNNSGGNVNDGRGGDGNGNGNGDDNNNGDNANPDEHPDKPNNSLGPEDKDILNESLNSPNHDALRLRLVHTANKITSEKQRLREEQDYLEDQ